MKKLGVFLVKFFCYLFLLTLSVNVSGQDNSNQKSKENNERLRSAKVYFIRSDSRYVNSEALENEILKQPEVEQWGLIITRDESASDLILEVTRKRWSKKFTFVVIDRTTNYVLLTGKIRDRWFHRVENLIARRFVERMKESR
jgi:hypothetical protein